MKAIHTRQQTIGVSMCAADGKMHPCAAFSLFQDIASEHAEMIGVGYHDMRARGTFWITVRNRIHFYRRPEILSRTDVTTWPQAPGKLRCNRFYRLSMEGETLAEGKTEWCIIDSERGSTLPLEQAGFHEGIEYHDEILLPAPYARFRHDFSDTDCASVHSVTSTDVDVGRHMNNVAYLRALMDSFSVEEIEDMEIREMEILYCMPCFEGDRLEILRRRTDYGWEFGVRRPDGRYAALALMRTGE